MRSALLLCLAVGLSASAAPFRLTVLNPECCAGGAGLCVVMQTPEGRTYLYDTAKVGADGYLAVSAAWPTDVTFTVEFQPASK